MGTRNENLTAVSDSQPASGSQSPFICSLRNFSPPTSNRDYGRNKNSQLFQGFTTAFLPRLRARKDKSQEMMPQYSSRNQRTKGFRIKRGIQIVLFLAVSVWLIYQIKDFHEKRKAYAKHKNNNPSGAHEILDYGRKMKFGSGYLIEKAPDDMNSSEAGLRTEDSGDGDDEIDKSPEIKLVVAPETKENLAEENSENEEGTQKEEEQNHEAEHVGTEVEEVTIQEDMQIGEKDDSGNQVRSEIRDGDTWMNEEEQRGGEERKEGPDAIKQEESQSAGEDRSESRGMGVEEQSEARHGDPALDEEQRSGEEDIKEQEVKVGETQSHEDGKSETGGMKEVEKQSVTRQGNPRTSEEEEQKAGEEDKKEQDGTQGVLQGSDRESDTHTSSGEDGEKEQGTKLEGDTGESETLAGQRQSSEEGEMGEQNPREPDTNGMDEETTDSHRSIGEELQQTGTINESETEKKHIFYGQRDTSEVGDHKEQEMEPNPGSKVEENSSDHSEEKQDAREVDLKNSKMQKDGHEEGKILVNTGEEKDQNQYAYGETGDETKTEVQDLADGNEIPKHGTDERPQVIEADGINPIEDAKEDELSNKQTEAEQDENRESAAADTSKGSLLEENKIVIKESQEGNDIPGTERGSSGDSSADEAAKSSIVLPSEREVVNEKSVESLGQDSFNTGGASNENRLNDTGADKDTTLVSSSGSEVLNHEKEVEGGAASYKNDSKVRPEGKEDL